MLGIDFDLARYVAYRKGLVEQRARDGAAYGFSGERKVRRALMSARPVAIAIEATTRLWKGSAKRKLLDAAEKVTDERHARVYQAARKATRVLGLDVPPVYVTDDAELGARALGTDEDAIVILSRQWVEQLDDAELTSVIGHELGHLQNNQVLYATALYYLQHEAVFFVRWIVRPAVMALQAWSRRAEITCDRAALLCAPDFQTAARALVKTAGGVGDDVDVNDYLQNLPEPGAVGKYAGIFRSHPQLSTRLRALRRFSESRFYQRAIGNDDPSAPNAESVDADVAELLSVF